MKLEGEGKAQLIRVLQELGFEPQEVSKWSKLVMSLPGSLSGQVALRGTSGLEAGILQACDARPGNKGIGTSGAFCTHQRCLVRANSRRQGAECPPEGAN